jgi:hypothetical protein
MTLPSNDRLSDLAHELEELRAELTRVRGQEMDRRTGRRGHSANAWLAAPLIMVAWWTLSAQTPGPISPEIEKRLSALESLIRRGPGNSTQVTAPFDVIGSDGKAILRVGKDNSAGAVAIWRAPGRPGGNVTIRSDNGVVLGSIGTANAGNGVAFTADAKGNPRAQLSGQGAVIVFDEKADQVGGIVVSEGRGRVAVWKDGKRVAAMDVDAEHGNAGALTVMNPAGKVVATMSVDAQDPNAGALSVMNSAGKPVAGLIGGLKGGGAVAVANPGGVTLAEMSVADDGRGLFQVFGRGQRPIAVLTEAKEYPGGLLQISNTSLPVANLTVGKGGGGYWQLTNASGVPTVEAGTLPSGRGTVRAGPLYKCSPIQAATPVLAVGLPDCLLGGH